MSAKIRYAVEWFEIFLSEFVRLWCQNKFKQDPYELSYGIVASIKCAKIIADSCMNIRTRSR